MKIPTKKIAIGLALLTLTACSSSFGEGSPPPHNTTVVVPPNSASTTSHTTTTTTNYDDY